MITKSTRIKDIYGASPVLKGVLDRFDFSKTNPNYSLSEACMNSSLHVDFVIAILKAFSDSYPFPATELSGFSINNIIGYLRKTHKFYLDKKIPEIELSFVQLSRDFSYSHPQLIVLGGMFMHYKKELEEHIDHEEYILFPYIEGLLKAKEKGKKISSFGLDKYSISDFEDEHHHDEQVLSEIRSSINQRFKGSEIPFPFRIFLHQVEALEKDLLKHAQVEDEVLLPLALQLEEEVKLL